MRIIKGRDYYDGAGHGVYTDIRFVRDRRELAGAPIDVPTVFERHRGRRRDDTLTFFALVVAGEVIPGAIHRAVPEPDRGATSARSTTRGKRSRRCSPPGPARSVGRYWRPWHASDADAFMARRGEGPWTRWLAEHQVVTGVIEGEAPAHAAADAAAGDDARRQHRQPRGLRGLPRPRPGDRAYADRELGRGRAALGAGDVEISNASRIRKAGFDLRTSFRSRPTPRAATPAAHRS